MRHLAALLLLAAGTLCARSAETVYFRAVMLPANEVPPTSIAASGAATIRAHVVRDDTGQVIDGSVDFIVGYQFPASATFTGLHIHTGVAGANGPISIDTGISAANSVVDNTGRGVISRQAQVRGTDLLALIALRGMLDNPEGFYVNLHTTEFPGGAIRGQLQRADVAVYVGMMSPANEVPAITTLDASGLSHVRVITTRDRQGAFTSAQMLFDLNYRFPEQVTFTGFHIHTGAAGVNGPIIFNTGIGSGAASVASTESGVGTLQYPVEVNLSRQVEADALAALFANPAALYINLHTTAFPGGVIRSQLRPTDTMRFQVDMLPSNEVPPVNLAAGAPAVVTVRTVRDENSAIIAGVIDFDVNHRFPGAAEFTGLHIHDAPAGTNGPITVDSGISSANPFPSETGFGNIFRSANVSSFAGLSTLNSLSRQPENHYVNLHTRVNPGGVVRAQLAPANTAPPVITSVMAANLDPNATTLAPGGLVSIFGTNLAKVTADLSGWQGNTLPALLNGTAVAVGNSRARLLYVSPTQVNAALSFDTPTGAQQIAVNNGNAPRAVNVTVAASAPALFFGPNGALALKNEDFSLIGPANPAFAGDIVLLYSTGLGQVTPALQTGALAAVSPIANTRPATVTIGGRNAEVIHSIAAPGFAGLYQTAVRVPQGVKPGNAPVVLSVAGADSAPVNLRVQ
ncbi:MAG TPA: CHRD domain-containing protein [Bryobacteraceae bacterium]|nr:CHRD domain-containing protein [Bryobacteraceae bacterium]